MEDRLLDALLNTDLLEKYIEKTKFISKEDILYQLLTIFYSNKIFNVKYQTIFYGFLITDNDIKIITVQPFINDCEHIRLKKLNYIRSYKNYIKTLCKFVEKNNFKFLNISDFYNDTIDKNRIKILTENNIIFDDFSYTNFHINSKYEIDFIYDTELADIKINEELINSL